jgi:pimeloyl-ACP methyl ester carboxylesterase
VDLLGHGTAPKPHDPAAYADLEARIVDALPDSPVDAVGFSLGALTLLRAAIADPTRFRRLVVAGVGDNVFQRDDSGTQRIVSALEGTDPADDNLARLFVQYADQPGQDRVALTAVMRRPPGTPITREGLATLTMPVLVAVGDRDFVGDGRALADSLPQGRLATLARTDHFATPSSFAFIDAMLDFLDAIPS